MFRAITVAVAAILCLLFAGTVDARRNRSKDQLVTLARHDVQLSQGHEAIDVSKADGSFRAIRISAQSPIEISRIQIIYADGSAHEEVRRINLKKGQRTREINRTRNGRFVDRIEIDYKTSSAASSRATLLVLGVQSRDGAKAQRPASASRPVTAGTNVLFGSHVFGFGVDRDTIRIGNQIGKFGRIRLRVLENEMYINEIKVIYAQGDPDTVTVNARVKKNARTGWFELKGDRFIKEIQLAYRSRPKFSGHARVEVFGDYADGWLDPDGEGQKYNRGWVLLGSQTADYIGFDNDVIPLAKSENGFKKFRLSVQKRAITLSELSVVYGNGQNDTIPVRSRLDAGATYGPIDVKGTGRTVREIRAKYRSRFFDKNTSGRGLALVQVWGHH